MPLPMQTQKHYESRLYDDVLLTFTATRDAFGTVSVYIDDVSVRDYRLLPLSLWPDETSGPRLLDWLNTRIIPKNRKFTDQILAQAGITDDSTFGVLDTGL